MGRQFKAFISYSHAADDRLAPALQTALQRFAKKWYERRAMRAFRDQTNLAANPALWASIEQALSNAEFFILLASPEAAASKWVKREVAHWLGRDSPETLLLVVTDGDVVWDAERCDFDWRATTAVPENLSRVHADEPFYVDLRWARKSEDLSLRNPRFADQVATLAAKLHGREKDDLIGEDVRQRRRFVMAWATAVVLLALATVASTAFWTIAVQERREAVRQRNEAQRQRDEAERRGRISLAQALAAEAVRLKDEEGRDDVAALLAAEAFRLNRENRGDRLSQIDQTIRGILAAPAYSVALDNSAAELVMLAIDRGGRLLAAGGDLNSEGFVKLWDLRQRAEKGSFAPSGGVVTAMDFAGPDSRLVLGTRDGHLSIWTVGDPVHPRQECTVETHRYSQIRSVSADSSGTIVAAGADDRSVAIVDGKPPCRVLYRLGPFDGIAWSVDFAAAQSLLAAAFGDGSVRVWKLDRSGAAESAVIQSGEIARAVAVDPSGRFVAVGTGGEPAQVALWDLRQSKSSPVWASRRTADVYALAFNATGDRLAAGSSDGTLSYWDIRGGDRRESTLPKQHALVSSVAFAARDGLLASVARGRNLLRLWHLAAPGRPEVLGGSGGSDQVYALGLGANGGVLASADGRANSVRVWDLRTSAAPFSTLRYGADDASSEIVSVAISPDGAVLAAGTADTVGGDNALLVWRLADKGRGPMRAPAQSAMRTLAFSPDGQWLAAATEIERVLSVWSVATGFKDVRRIPLTARVLAACFASTGARLVLALDDNSLKFWQPQSAQPDAVTLFARDAGPIARVACLESRGQVATGAADGRVRVWDAQGRSVFDLPGQEGSVTAIGTDKGARILVTGNDRGVIRVWTLDNPNHVPVVIPSTLIRVASLIVEPSGEWIAAAGGDARVLRFDLTAALLRKMEARSWRNLTLQEWARFIGAGLAPRATFDSLPPPR